MTGDRTEYQSTSQISKGKKLSLRSTRPPAQIPGYAIQKMLGSGAFGEVWAGVDQKTGRRVAIKFYTRRSSLDVTLLSSEVEKLVFLAADRYVVQLLDVGWDASPPYYVMDYIDNGSLEDELARVESFDVAQAVELFDEICVGLMHLHGKGILHCDLKPGNVLLDQDLKPRLADFGQSRLSHEQSPSLGTLYYMAPEQADLDAVPDARWDVYALGALLYTMLTGSPPYRNENLSSSLETKADVAERLKFYREEIARADRPNEHRLLSGVDRELADIIDRCIAIDPKKRFSSVQSVYYALKQRELAHTRRPLIVLGILGPLMLLAIVGGFGYKLYADAIQKTDGAVTDKAIESNEWVAKFAAANAGEQIDNYIQAVVQLSSDEDFENKFRKVIEDDDIETLRESFRDPNYNSGDDTQSVLIAQKRVAFIEKEIRKNLEQELTEINREPRYSLAASWFICDKYGTQLAAKYNTQEKRNTRGKNYSYRTYFTGRERDMVDPETARFTVDVDPEKREHIVNPHVSTIFKSTGVNTWKIAFSAPIILDGEFAGIVAVTVEMGSFIDFSNRNDHYVMLVDNRRGEHQGIILEHPLFDQIKEAEGELPQRFSNYHLAPEKLANSTSEFYDPLGQDSAGDPYDHRYLAAFTSVRRSKIGCELDEEESDTMDTGLLVVAVERYDQVSRPVQDLGKRLWWLSLAAIATIITLVFGLWMFLMRVINRNRKRHSRAFTASTESNGSLVMGSGLGRSDLPPTEHRQTSMEEKTSTES